MAAIDAILDDFELLDDWDDRYRYLIELGGQLEPLAESERNAGSKVRGCASQVWIVDDERDGGRLHFRGDSDAHIVRGLIAIVLALFSDRTPAEIAATDERAVFGMLRLEEHITPQRSNGLRAMVERIRQTAAAATAAAG